MQRLVFVPAERKRRRGLAGGDGWREEHGIAGQSEALGGGKAATQLNKTRDKSKDREGTGRGLLDRGFIKTSRLSLYAQAN